MRKNSFQFKQFTLFQDRCAMKVGTDGVLLGAWCDLANAKSALDVGTGTGIVALMVAQRFHQCAIDAVEIDPHAAQQASENVALSSFASQVRVLQGDCLSAQLPLHAIYDHIVSNPPYFINALQAAGEQRTIARHTHTLSYLSLFNFARLHLAQGGKLSLIYPFELHLSIVGYGAEAGMYLGRHTWVHTKGNLPPKRVLAEYSPIFSSGNICDKLIIHNESGGYTPEYVGLTHNFYLKM